jgi:hypothetical protein
VFPGLGVKGFNTVDEVKWVKVRFHLGLGNQVIAMPKITFRCPKFLLLVGGLEVGASLGSHPSWIDGTN